MEIRTDDAATVDDYIKAFPPRVRVILQRLRKTIHEAAPRATERVSYKMPAFEQNGILVWFGAHAKHVGFYPGADGISTFQKKLSGYKSARGSVQFPLDAELPYELVKDIVRYRVARNEEKAAAKSNGRGRTGTRAGTATKKQATRR